MVRFFIYKFLSLFSSEARKWDKQMRQNKINRKELYIRDDEVCPCGSGKQFISCCKRKIDTFSAKSPKPISVILGEEINKTRNSKKICIHPDQSNCKGKIKKAHALQNHKILSLLSEKTGHVYCLDKSKHPVVISDNPVDPLVIGMFTNTSVNSATTETCFCDYHDTVVFSSIESGAPDFVSENEEMKFTYAYKSFAFEYYNFLIEFMVFRELFKKRPQVFSLADQVAYYRMLRLKQAEFEPIKKHYDNEIMSGTHNGITTCVIELPYQIRFANYAFIAPDFDVDGRLVCHTKDGVMHRLSITVFPEKTRSYILMSCLESEKDIYQDFFDSIKSAQLDKVTYYFSLILPLYSENIVISKSLWNDLDEMGQIGLTHLINLHGVDALKMSRTLSMALLNANKKKNFNYSARTKIDLFR